MVTVSPSGPPGLFKGVTTPMSGVLARFPLLLPVRNSFASYGALLERPTSPMPRPRASRFVELRGVCPCFFNFSLM